MAGGGTLNSRRIAVRLLLAAVCVLGVVSGVEGDLSGQPRRDPLGLSHWLNDKPLPSHIARRSRPGSAVPPSPQSRRRRQLLQPIRESALAVRPAPEAAARAPAPVSDWVSVALDADNKGLSIPSTFLGISHEWTNIEELNHGGTYQQLLQDLTAYGGGPLVLRVGGGSTDKQTAPPPASVFQSLTALHKATGMLFILGLNFEAGDISLARSQMDAIKAALPPESLLSLELGNEPNFYSSINGRSSQDYLNCCFVNDWAAFARQLSCRGNYSTCVHQQLAGPAWGHVHMTPRTLDWWLKFNNFWVNLVTVHWYQATREAASTVEHLLDQAPIDGEMANLRQLVQVANRYSRPLRVAEMNSISNSGRQGISNSLAAALWTLDGALEVAATGSVGINLHWGDGLSLYAALLRQASGTSIVKPPYYAYLMLQMALGSGSSLVAGRQVQAEPGSLVKVWPLVDAASGSLRVVLINKHTSQASGVAISLAQPERYQDGKLIRLLGRRGLSEEWGVSLGNVTYKIGGASAGSPAGELIRKQQAGGGGQASRITLEAGQQQGEAGQQQQQQGGAQERGGARGGGSYSVLMPPGSAALLVIPRVRK